MPLLLQSHFHPSLGKLLAIQIMKCLVGQYEKTLAETSVEMKRLYPYIEAPREQDLPTFPLSAGRFSPDSKF